MLNIKEMIESNDFSALINSTEEDRKNSGGNEYLYSQFKDFIYLDYIKEILKFTFKNDEKILKHINKYYKNKSSESSEVEYFMGDYNSYSSIKLP